MDNVESLLAQNNNRVRTGKTARDAASGAKARRQQNRAARDAWNQQSTSKASTFPLYTCNGKKSRALKVT